MQNGKEARECVLQIIHTRMAFKKAMQRVLKKHNTGITFEMFQILSCLWQEQGISQQTFAERTAKDKASLTSLMTNMEKRGFVRREESKVDRRNNCVYLTELGVDLQQKINPAIYELYSYIEKEIGLSTIKKSNADLKRLHSILEDFE